MTGKIESFRIADRQGDGTLGPTSFVPDFLMFLYLGMIRWSVGSSAGSGLFAIRARVCTR